MDKSGLGKHYPLWRALQLSPITHPPEAQQSPHTAPSSPSQPTETIPTSTPTEIPTLRQYSRRARIAQSMALPTAADERQDRENIIKTSTLPRDSTPRVTSLVADKGSMQQQLYKLTDLYTRLQRQQTEMATKIAAQELEISSLKERIKLPEDKDKGTAEQSRDDAPIKGRSLETWEEAGVEKSTERGREEVAKKGSNDTKEMINFLTSMDAATILSSGVAEVPTGSGSIPTASPLAAEVPTGNDVVPTA
nr:hypothetical protein [Tanacetum cinerariifolium]